MLCDSCKERDAVVNLTQIVENVVSHLHLCERCAADRGVEPTVGMPQHPLGQFLAEVQQQVAVPATEVGRCSFCGASMKDFRASGRLGCARCYPTFEGSLRELLRRVHGHSRHVGRVYEPPAPETMEQDSIRGELRERLRRAIESEQFELAAELRDKIRVLDGSVT